MPNETGLRHFILATAGHVDHGKTGLIKALTGTDTDRLPEEKKRGITIELGFAHLAFPGVSLGIIDVPGHEDFVRNMIAGMGAIDLALLVVAADDGWMPQTEEHLQILDYLGVRHGVVALTKCDLGEREKTAEQVRARLQGSSLGGSQIVRTSIRTGAGLDDLRAALAQVASTLPPVRDVGKPRLFVDRVFSVHGSGTVVTGTLTGGRLRRGQTILLQPQCLQGRVRALQSHNQPLDLAEPGSRVALNLPDLRPEEIPRGSVVASASKAEPSLVMDALISRSGRDLLPARPLKSASTVQVHAGSARYAARIVLLDRRELVPGERSIARLQFSSPIFAFAGDRFVLRDPSGRATIAGGVVLDSEPAGRRFRSSPARLFLQARANSPNELSTLLRSQLRRDRFVATDSLLSKSNFSAEEIRRALERMERDGEVCLNESFVADLTAWEEARRRALAEIAAEHKTNPHHPGLPLARLRESFAKELPGVFEALVQDLCKNGVVRAGDVVRQANHRPALPPPLHAAGEKIRRALKAKPFDPPSRAELAPDEPTRQALRFFLENGEAVEIGPEVVLSRDAFREMRARVVALIGRQGPATTGALRQALQSSRRIVVPFLERLDREGITRRVGDKRVLAAK